MRLTADVIVHARAGINPCDERELDLRGYKIPMIENLGVTQDQFDAIDFSDNEIKKLDNFPRYKRLSSLLLCNNHISRIAADIGNQLPNLSCLILTNNKLSSLGDLEGLGTCKKLTIMSLLHNEVVSKQYYRLYVINLVPSLKQLDFQRITLKEREAAGRLARSQAGKAMRQDVAQEVKKAKTFTPGKPVGEEQKLTDEHRAIYAERIARATTVDEVEMLSRKIQAGIIPSATYKQAGGVGPGVSNGSAASAVEGDGMDSEGGAPAVAAGEVDGGKEAGSKDDKQASEETSTVDELPTETNTTIEEGTEEEAAKPPSPSPASEKVCDNDEMMNDANPAPSGPPAPAPAPAGVEEMHGASVEGEAEMAVEAEEGVEGESEAEAESVLPTTSSMDVDGDGETAGDGNDALDGAAPESGKNASGAGSDNDGDVGNAMAVENGDGVGREEEEDTDAPVDAAATAAGGDRGLVADDSVAGDALEGGRQDEGEESKEVADGAADMEEDDGAGAGGEPKLSEGEIKKFKVVELRKELAELQLPTNGLKAALQARLLAAMGYTD